MSRGTTGFVCLLVLSFGALNGWAQVSIQPRIAPSAREPALPSLRVNTNLVLVPVSVTDASNRPLLGLDTSSFRIFDNNIEQQLASLAFEDAPVAIAVVFDMSGSMRPKMRKSRLALARLLETANPEDEFCLIEFSDAVDLAKSWTSDPREITGALADAVPRGRTALLDAIALGLSEVKKSTKPRKAIVIVSDGGDNRSRLTERELRSMARESDALIYAMGIFEGMGVQLSLEELAGPGLLEEITEAKRWASVPSLRRESSSRDCSPDRSRTAQPIRAGILAEPHAARRPASPGSGPSRAAGRNFCAARRLARRLPSAGSITRVESLTNPCVSNHGLTQ